MVDNQDLRTQAADILVVDDTIASLQLLIEILSKAGYHVRPADGAQVALESALAHPPSLILLDVRMPEMDGFEVCRRLKQDDRTRDVPIIFISALQEVDDRVQGFEVGGVDFVSKPIEEAEILARVNTHLQLRDIQLGLSQLVSERTADLGRASEVLEKRDAILEAVAFAAERFLLALNWEVEIDAVLEHLGKAAGVSRVYVFQNHTGSQGEILASQRFEWCAPGVSPQTDNPDLQGFPLRAGGFGRWEEMLGRGDHIHGHVRAFPESEREVLTAQEIQSLVIVPVFAGGQWWGFIGFDECAHERDWSQPEREALRAAAGTFGAAIERMVADAALRESEERYRSLVEQAQDAIVVLQDGKIRFANSYAAALSGRTVEMLLDTPFEAYLMPDELPKIADIYQRRMKGEAVPSIYESAIQHQDGSPVEVEFNAGLTTYDGKPADLVFVRDIRERVKAQQELQAYQHLVALVTDSVPALVSYVDTQQRYRFVNQRYEQTYGIPRLQFVGKHVREVLGPDGYAGAEKHIVAALAGEAVSYEDVFSYPDRGQRWMRIDYVPDIDDAGEVQGFIGMISDITERKLVEQALRESEDRLRAIYQAIPVATYTWQRKDGDFVLVDFNHMADRVTQGKIAELIGVIASELYREQPEIPQAIARCLFERTVIEQEMDYLYITTGRRRHLNVKYAFAPPDLVVIHTEDITERKLAEQRIMAYHKRMQGLASQLTLVEEKERRRIAADLHDDVGQTLALARIQLAAARQDTSNLRMAAMLDEASETIRQAIHSTRDLVFDLSSPLLNEIGLEAAVAEWLEEKVAKPYGLETEFIGAGQPLSLDDDVRAMLFRSVRELLANVIRHAQADKVSVRLERSREGLRIVVQDDGVGFEEEASPPMEEGKTGFGLFSIRERMSDLGGTLEIVSKPGAGCMAILTVPSSTD